MTTKFLSVFLALTLLSGLLPGQQVMPIENLENYVVAGGYRPEGEAQHFLIKFSKAEWEKAEEARKLFGYQTNSLEVVNQDPGLNREYLGILLVYLRGKFNQDQKKSPSPEQIFLLWKMGDKFRKINYDPGKVKDKNILIQLEHFRTLNNSRAEVQRTIPTPLFSDGRKVIPLRFVTRQEVQSQQKLPPIQVPPPTR